MDTCKNCHYWGFRDMISKPYGYAGDIPCLRCKRFNEPQDLFTPITKPECPQSPTPITEYKERIRSKDSMFGEECPQSPDGKHRMIRIPCTNKYYCDKCDKEENK